MKFKDILNKLNENDFKFLPSGATGSPKEAMGRLLRVKTPLNALTKALPDYYLALGEGEWTKALEKANDMVDEAYLLMSEQEVKVRTANKKPKKQ